MMRDFRTFAAALLTTGAAILVVACGSDLSTAPGQPASPLTPHPLGSFDRGSPAPSPDVTVKFTIKPNEELYVQIGLHYLYIPANVVCDPKTSGYGVTFWKQACTTISGKTTITVNATASTYNGHPIVTFDQHLRFKPTNDSHSFVMLYLHDVKGDSKSSIFWCPDAERGSKTAPVCVDETPTSLAPSQIQTRWDSGAGFIYRRIEHFSGYNVTAGDSGDGLLGGGL
jgi:hypothetical protein